MAQVSHQLFLLLLDGWPVPSRLWLHLLSKCDHQDIIDLVQGKEQASLDCGYSQYAELSELFISFSAYFADQ